MGDVVELASVQVRDILVGGIGDDPTRSLTLYTATYV